ncbi:MAG TPA: hypothetical protein VFN67_04785 [Polyangiales bacterium]|nr:hypothetical protein [Polyangiales bacterium]
MPGSRGRLTVWLSLALTVTTPYARAQSGEEVIDDPELGGTSSSFASDSSGDQVIEDPELSAANGSNTAASSSESSAPVSELHLTLHVRGNRDLKEEDPREELWETTGALILDATLRRSEHLRFGLGMIMRYHYAALGADVPDAKAQRFELGVVPTAGYIDASLADGLHVRAGYQTVALGRFDVFSATNVLTVNDLRDGPSAIPGTTEVGQLALLIDYDPVDWLSFRAVYVPFFMPHLFNVTDSDYALFPARQADYDAVLMSLQDILPVDQLRAQLGSRILRSARDQIAQSTLSAFGPQPTPLFPQGALRATAHGLFGEIAFTFSTALEHLPALRLSDAAITSLATPDQASSAFDPEPVRVEYNRFFTISADAAVDLAPFSLGFELAYQFHRTLYAVGTAFPEDRYSIPVPGFTDIVQAGSRLEWLQDTTWVFTLETFAAIAVQVPDDSNRGWMLLEDGRLFRGAAALLGYSTEFGLQLQLAAAWISGPTVIVSPRIAYAFVPQVELEVGAFVIDGQMPPTEFVTPILSLGGIFNNLDHVYVGLRATL